MKSFKEYKNDRAGNKVLYATFGRYNPPHLGHLKVFNRLKSLADSDNADYLIYSSQSQDNKKNPLDYDTKIKFLRKMFPEFARHFVSNKSIKNALQIATAAHDEGYNRFVFVVGGDRIADFKKLLSDYNGKAGAHGLYNFKTIEVKSAGERDPDSEGVDGMSSSKLKAAAVEGDIDKFMLGMPRGFKEATALYNAVRSGLGVKESSYQAVDDVREAYISGNIFNVGDHIIAKSQSYVIVERHSNFVSAKSPSGEIKKFFLNQISLDESKVLEYGTTHAANIYKRDTPGQLLSDAKRFVQSEKSNKSITQKRKAQITKYDIYEESWEAAYKRRVVKTTDPERKAAGFIWRIKGKEKDNLTIKYFKNKPSFEEFSAEMRLIAGHEFGK